MAYDNISNYQNTTNKSERDIEKKFNSVEFNRIFEQNNLNKVKQQETPIVCSEKSKLNTLFIIICIILATGILLLLFNNFISVD
jgi:hypothetical protein